MENAMHSSGDRAAAVANVPRVDPLPIALQVEMTSRCNLKCVMCPLTTGNTLSSHAAGHMSVALWRKVTDVGRRTGRVIVAGFGEPLLNRDCFLFLGMLEDAGIKFSLVTNATLLTPERAAALASMNHLFHINISLDSPDPNIYRQIRGGEVEQALSGVGNLMATGIDERRVTISSVVMERNLASLRAVPPLLAQMGIHHYVLQGLVDLSTHAGQNHLRLSPQIEDRFDAIRRAAQQAGVVCEFMLPERLEQELSADAADRLRYFGTLPATPGLTRRCLLPWELPYLDKDGRVYPCCYAASSPAAVVGNLNDEPFDAIWTGTPMETFRERLSTGVDLPSVCAGCTAVPWGTHPLREYRAEVLLDESSFRSWHSNRLVVRNVGTSTWTKTDAPCIGTSGPRDRQSAAYDASWLSANRVGAMRETSVQPGERASYTFRLAPRFFGAAHAETFQLVVDGVCWLPGTRFSVERAGLARRALGAFMR